MIRKAASALAMFAVVLLPSSSIALGLGGIEVNSGLNEPLSARIGLRSLTTRDAGEMKITLGTDKQFERAGIERPYYLSKLRFKVIDDGDGKGHVEVTTANPINEPFLNFLVEVNWPRGRVIREYTVLLDPPVYGAAITDTTRKTVKPVTTTPGASGVGKRLSSAAASSSGAGSQPLRTAGGTYGPVGVTDTLWSIAAAQRPDSSVSVQRMMLAILAANPDAFVIPNVNALRAGSVLKMPGTAELEATEQRSALTEVRRQHAEWGDYRQQLGLRTPPAVATAPSAATTVQKAPSATDRAIAKQDGVESKVAEDDGKLKLVAPGTERGTSDGNIAQQIQGLRDDLNLAREEIDSQRQQTKDLESRLGQAENLVQDLQRLVEMKEDVISELQNKLAESEAALQQARSAASEPAQQTPAQGPKAQKPVAEPQPLAKRKPAPDEAKKKRSAPKPRPQPSFLDTLEEIIGVDPIIAGAALGGVMLVGIGGFALARRRQRPVEEADEDPVAEAGALAGEAVNGDAQVSPEEISADSEGPSTDVGVEPESDLVSDEAAALPGHADTAEFDSTEVSSAAEGVAPTDDDPLTEVNVYLAYERYDHAESLVREAIAQYPDRPEYRLRLLEVFHSAKNTAGFEETAAELQAAVGDDHPHMDQARRWWGDLNPGVALLAGGAAAAAAATVAADEDIFDITTPDEVGALDAQLSDQATDDTSVDFDLGFEMADESDEQVAGQSAIDFDLSFDGPDEAAVGAEGATDRGVDLDVGGGADDVGVVTETGENVLELSPSDTTVGELGASTGADVADGDPASVLALDEDGAGADTSEVDFDLDFDLSDTGEVTAPELAAGADDDGLDIDLGTLDEFSATDERNPLEAEPQVDGLDFDLDAIDEPETTDELNLSEIKPDDDGLDFDLDAIDEPDTTDELNLSEIGPDDDRLDLDLGAVDELGASGELDSPEAAVNDDERQFDADDIGDVGLLDDGAETLATDEIGRDLDLTDDAGLQDAVQPDFSATDITDDALTSADEPDPLNLDLGAGDGTVSDGELATEELDFNLDTEEFEPGELDSIAPDSMDLTLDTSELIAAADTASADSGTADPIVADGASGPDAGMGEASELGGTSDLSDLDLDLSTGDLESDSESGTAVTGLDLDFSSDADVAGDPPGAEGDGSGLDFDLSFGEEEAVAATSGADSELDLNLEAGDTDASEGTDTDLDFDLSFGEAAGDEDQQATVRLNLDDLPGLDRGDAAADGSSGDIDSEFQDIFASDDGTGTAENFDIDFDLGIGGDTADEASTLMLGGSTEGDVDEVQTKLDLAQAYLDMEDLEGARGILGEVLAQGNEGQQEIARNMLSKLD